MTRAWTIPVAIVVAAVIVVVGLGPETSASSCEVWRADVQLASSRLEASHIALAEAREAAHEELTPLLDSASHSRLTASERYPRQDRAPLVAEAEQRFGVPRLEVRRDALANRYVELLERRPRRCKRPGRD